jgi:tetratricopeptide (TPR) repeat protein
MSSALRRALLIIGLWASMGANALAHSDQAEPRELCAEGGEPLTVVEACTAVLGDDRISAENRAIALSNRGNALLSLGDLTLALADFDEAIAANPNYSHAFSNRGGVFALRGDFDQAFADLGEAIRLDPTNLSAFGNRALTHQLRGEYQDAIADFTRVLELDPNNVEGLNGRCWVRVLWDQQLDQALADCEAALQRDPEHANALNSRAAVRFLQRDFRSAERDYDASFQLAPRMTGSLYGRGVSRMRLGRTEEGRADISAATTQEAGVADRYAQFGVRP